MSNSNQDIRIDFDFGDEVVGSTFEVPAEEETLEYDKGGDIFGEPLPKYADMLTGYTEAPAFAACRTGNLREYHRRRGGYHSRLDKERRDFNKAITDAGNAREARIARQIKHKKQRKVLLCVGAVLLAILVVAAGIGYGVYYTNTPEYLSQPEHLYKYNDYGDGVNISGMKRTQALNASGALIIPTELDGKKVVRIGGEAFAKETDITSVVVPNSVKSIGNGAFYGCTNIKSMTLPFVGTSADDSEPYFGKIFGSEKDKTGYSKLSTEQKTSQGETAQGMYGSNTYCGYSIPASLTTVTITSQSKIGENAFVNCDKLTSITYSSLVTSIGKYAFKNCTSLTTLPLKEGTTEVGDFAFMNCSGVKSVTIPSSLTMLNPGVFYGCKGLTSVVVPETVTDIRSAVFGGCSRLESITLPFIGRELNCSTARWAVFGYIFGDDSPGNDSMESKSTICKTSSGKYTSQVNYYGSKFIFDIPMTLKNVTITQKLDKVPNEAFINCDLLQTITFAQGYESAGTDAFTNCTATIYSQN